MSSSERQRLQEDQLKEEIVELRGELGDTVEALVHKADLPARAKERGAELTERAVDRAAELRDQAVIAAERAREVAYQTPPDRWIKLASAGLALVALVIIVRRIRVS